MNEPIVTPPRRVSWFQAAGQRLRARFAPQMQHAILFLVLCVMLLTSLAPLVLAGWGIAPPRAAQASAGTPNLFDPHSQANSISHPQPAGPGIPAGPQTPPATVQRTLPMPMQPALVPLVPGQAVHFLGSDGLLQVDLPADAVTPAEVSQALGGQLYLKITQLSLPSGSNAGGSGHVSLGSYRLAVVDVTGRPVSFGLAAPVTLALHTESLGRGLNLAQTQVVFQGGESDGQLSAYTSPLGGLHSQTATLDPIGHTLQVSTQLASASTSVSFNTDAPVAAFGKPNPFNTDLSAGALTFSEPLNVPAGPGGLTPPLTLAYSSEGVSEQHNVQAAAGWVGEGWNLSLGEISWAEHNVYAHCYQPCSGPYWENSWQLSDPFGTSAELIPPTSGVSTYYDDTPNLYYSSGSYPNQPVLWHTADESHVRIYSYVGPDTLPNMPARVSCFRVYLPNGLMEEYGCTPDSIEYYFQPGSNGSLNSYYIAKWLLDLITDPQGNQIHVTYQADMSSFQGWSYTRDVEPATVSWDSPGCHNSQSACTGSSWAPLMQVNFVASHSVARPTPLQSGWPCNTGSNLRCDDPLDESGSGGVPAPLVQNTFVLNDIQVQARSSGSASWNMLTDYQLSYEQTGAGTFTDPVSGTQESFAGALDLTQIQQVGDDGSATLPPRTFSYVSLREHYVDSFGPQPQPAGNCGWGWSGNPNCYLWFESLDSNGRYISSASNGLGLAQTFSWAEAHDNSHGFGWWADSTDPLYCNSNSSSACNETDDQAWSHIVLTSQSASVVRPSSSGNITVTSTTSYRYHLSILTAQPWSDGVTGMYWGNQNDADYLDFYNNTFMGFAQVGVTHPDGSVDLTKYYATEGIGLYDTGQVSCYGPGPCDNDPWWDPGNALHGRPYEVDHYNVDGKTLLKQETTQYQLTCPPSGVSGTPASGWGSYDGHLVSELDRGNPVAVCDIQPSQSQTITFDGPSFSGAASYEAESPVNTLTGGAQIQACSACSGGEQVDWLGQSATLQFNQVSVPSAGTYALTLYYSNGDAGSIPATLSVNGGRPILLSFASTGGWFTVGTLVIAVALQAGNNTLLLGNPAGGAPNFDRLTVSASVPVVSTTSTTYDSYGRVTSTTTTSSDGTTSVKGSSPTTIIQTTSYIWNDALTPTLNGVTGTYLIDFPAFSDTEDTAGNRYSCSYTSYDGQGYATGQQSSLTLGEATTSETFNACLAEFPNIIPSPYYPLTTTTTYDQYGNVVATTDPDGNAGNSAHKGCTVGSSQYTSCTTYDSTFAFLTTSTSNALNQTSSTTYTQSAAGGFGLWPTSATDPNGQTTSTAYDPLGRVIGTTLPGETSGLTTTSTSYTDWCSGTAAQTPCVEIDKTQRLDSGTTVTSRAFYDGWGHLVETRNQASNGQDVVQYAYYDPSGRKVFTSIPYFVTAYAGVPGPTAFATPDASQPGTSTTYTNLLSTTTKDALSHATTTSTQVECGFFGDPGCYVLATTIDPLNHKSNTVTDAWGRTAYTRTNTGNSGSTYQAYTDIQYGYTYLGKVAWVGEPNGTTNSPTGAYTTYTYDAAGHQTGMTDPDRGTSSYSYDQNGNLIEVVDARGTAGTVFIGYDGLNRMLWRNTTNSPTGAFVTYSYDSTQSGNVGIGRLTGETFQGGSTISLSGAYSNVYDGRGQQTRSTVTLGGTGYTLSTTYDDAGHVLSQTYPDGEVVTTSYTAQGWLAGLSTQQGSTTTTLLGNVSYSGTGGAAGNLTGATLGNGVYTYAAQVDVLGRPTDLHLTQSSSGQTLFESKPSYDAAGNVSSVTTTLPGGTDVQQFCYDALNRLTWAGSVGTPPCTGTAITSGTLTSAAYQQSFSYDTLDRLTSSPLGSYTYGDSAHLHAVTSVGAGYTASYDATGNRTCRATAIVPSCTGTPTGAQLSYDAEGQLVGWQNAPSSPTSSTADLYDGEGHRVEQQVTQQGQTTTIFYLGDKEEVAQSGTTTTTTYYSAGGHQIALAVNGVFSYLASDKLGTASVALSASGTVQASRLYAPYGTLRYQSGIWPGSYGFTGQRADAATGLDYYNARYYDPVAGVFLSADTEQGNAQGMNPYAYVKGNPETLTDPTGHRFCVIDTDCGYIPPPTPQPTPGGCGCDITQAPAPTNPSNPTGNPDCGSYSANACNQGKQDKQAEVSGNNQTIALLTLGINFLNLVADGIQLWHDIRHAVGPLKLLEVLGDAISLGGDAGVFLAQLGGMLHWRWLQVLGDQMGIWLSGLSAAYKAIRAILSTGWGTFAAYTLSFMVTAAIQLYGGGLGVLSDAGESIASALAKHYMAGGPSGKPWGNPGTWFIRVGTTVLQTFINAVTSNNDTLNSESTADYLRSKGVRP